MAKVNPIRFSTKYQDDESDLLYYGYRYYKPSHGGVVESRSNRANEEALNLYGFIGNRPISVVDRFGLIGDPGPDPFLA